MKELSERLFVLTGSADSIQKAFFACCGARNIEPWAIAGGATCVEVSAFGKTATKRTLPTIARRFRLELKEV